MPKCKKCGREMTGGAPHGPWPVQYECRSCNEYAILIEPVKEQYRREPSNESEEDDAEQQTPVPHSG